MNMLLIIKVKVCMLIEWSYMSLDYVDYWPLKWLSYVEGVSLVHGNKTKKATTTMTTNITTRSVNDP